MKNYIKNKKGILYFAPVTVLGTFHLVFLLVGVAALWHIPAWTKAKANHAEAAYQTQKMWPQQLFDKLPGGGSHTIQVVSGGNGGNFSGGNSGPVQ